MRAAWLILLVACGVDREILILPEPPIDDRTESLVLVLEGTTTILHAIDVDSRPTPLLRILASGWTSTELKATSFAFPHPLAFYDLIPGELAVVGGARSCGLKEPHAVAEYDPDAGWRTIDPPRHDAIGKIVDEATYGCNPVDLCRNFDVELVELSLNADVHLNRSGFPGGSFRWEDGNDGKAEQVLTGGP